MRVAKHYGKLVPKHQLIRVFKQLKVNERGCLKLALDKLKALGWSVQSDPGQNTVCYDNIWTNTDVQALNKVNKTSTTGILSHYYLDLYEVIQEDDLPEVFSHAPFKLLIGRIGNTTAYTLEPPKKLRDDRRDEGQLYFDFYE